MTDAADVRVGSGFDAHPWDGSRPLYLAGARFDGTPGLAGHSDGDVVCHALADALLGAAALGDIGQHFPETDPATAGIAGLDLLTAVVRLLSGSGLSPRRVDVTVIAEQPVIAPRREQMRSNLAGVLVVPVKDVSVKATRPEGLGLTGAGVGCMAVAVVVPQSSAG
jgi:2-C-methyl-D-erythritol 2,4-cyclodiphosphate synthase